MSLSASQELALRSSWNMSPHASPRTTDPTVQPHQTAADSGLDIPISWSGLSAKQTLLQGNGYKWFICEEVEKENSLGEKPIKGGVTTRTAWGPIPEMLRTHLRTVPLRVRRAEGHC